MTSDQQNTIVITAVGAVTAAGGNAKMTRAAIRAGIVPFNEHKVFRARPEYPDWDEDLPVKAAVMPFISPYKNDLGRFQDMAVPVIAEVMAQSGILRKDLPKTGLLLTMPEEEPTLASLGLNKAWLNHLLKVTGLGALAFADMHRSGSTGTFALIQQASALLQSAQIDYCIVGGIDSFLFEQRIAYYDTLWRIKTARNVDGFIPGEAAAMFLLETYLGAQKRGAKVLACLDGVGIANEDTDIASDRASSGSGLSQAIRQALAASSRGRLDDIKQVHCSVNGESYFAYEWGIVQSRLGAQLCNLEEINHPADCVGEVGAAMGALLVVNATLALEKSQQPERLLVFASSNNKSRASAILRNN